MPGTSREELGSVRSRSADVLLRDHVNRDRHIVDALLFARGRRDLHVQQIFERLSREISWPCGALGPEADGTPRDERHHEENSKGMASVHRRSLVRDPSREPDVRHQSL
jgi:hypothetical protein